MLVGGSYFSRHRVAFLLIAVALYCLPAAIWFAAARFGWLPWPSGSRPVGFWFGVTAFAIILFEMLLWFRKKLRGRRLGATRKWMIWHIWLGLLSVPLAICHSGFAFGGALSATAMVLFVVAIASGVWGLLMQQIIPRKLLEEIPAESIAIEMGSLMMNHLAEVRGLLKSLHASEAGPYESGVVVVANNPLYQLDDFVNRLIVPYLMNGRRVCPQLGMRTRREQSFIELRRLCEIEHQAFINRLAQMCDDRRQLDAQIRLHNWLHGWLCVHVPLSWALLILVTAHAVIALKLW